jgi:hypothetical protein
VPARFGPSVLGFACARAGSLNARLRRAEGPQLVERRGAIPGFAELNRNKIRRSLERHGVDARAFKDRTGER